MVALPPVLQFAPELLLKAQGVRIVFLDVDGVLTDGGVYIAADSSDPACATEPLKRFHTLDGQGLKYLRQAGIVPAVITGRDSPALRARVQALGIEHAHYGMEDKRPAAEQTLQALGLAWSDAAAMGDDWPDLPVLRRAAFACAPANAHAEVKAVAAYVTSRAGGDGAVRELCDLLLVASGHYAALLAQVGQ
jgi:3-deoxy-D-manno-octulosonate 8-phosphate phosphatase (KDO 8-P phosphatase)